MPDEILNEAGKSLINADPVLGAVCVFLIAALGCLVVIYRKDIRREQDAHEATRKQHLADVKLFAQTGESIRETMKVQVAAFQAAIELLKDRRSK